MVSRIGAVMLVVMTAGVMLVSAETRDVRDYSNRTPRNGLIKALLPYINLRFNHPYECNTGKTVDGVKELGTCMSKHDCKTAKGREGAECANGYGTCCVFEALCGGDVERNRTYLTTNSSTSGSLSCTYKIKMPANDSLNTNLVPACQIRLDFESFIIGQPDSTTSLCSADYFEVTNSPAAFGKICGKNTGQHIYIPIGSKEDVATITIAGSANSTISRNWRIRANYIPCNSSQLAPYGCLQYHTGESGSIKTFNLLDTTSTTLSQIGGLSYSICVGDRSGSCGLKLDATKFSLTGDANVADASKAPVVGNTCTDSVSLMIRAADGKPDFNTYFCGNKFNSVSTYARPFTLQYVTDQTEPATDKANAGFSMSYSRLPC